MSEQKRQTWKGQTIATPCGVGQLTQIGRWLVGDEQTHEIGYGVTLDEGEHAGEQLAFLASELRPLNAGTFFPRHTGEILR